MFIDSEIVQHLGGRFPWVKSIKVPVISLPLLSPYLTRPTPKGNDRNVASHSLLTGHSCLSLRPSLWKIPVCDVYARCRWMSPGNNYFTISAEDDNRKTKTNDLGNVARWHFFFSYLLFLITEITLVWENTNYKVFNICRCDSKSTNCCVQWSLCKRMWSHCKWDNALWSLASISCAEKGRQGGQVERKGSQRKRTN